MSQTRTPPTQRRRLRLSAMDVQWPGDLPELVPHLDELGYYRYWTTEHHGPVQSASPTLLAALAAGLSERMRIGTAAVLLRFHNPLAVAEDFRLLELFFGDRLDLGVASAAPPEPVRSALLDGRPTPDADGYARRVEELVRLVRRRPAAGGGVDGGEVGPRPEPPPAAAPRASTVPEIWVCGTSAGSARLAARLGACFAFHDFLNRSRPQPADGPAAVEVYRSEFRPDDHLASPKFNVAVYGVCADSEERARSLWRQAPEPGFCGPPERCREQLLELADRYGTGELVVQSMTDDLAARLESYRLLAEALEL